MKAVERMVDRENYGWIQVFSLKIDCTLLTPR